MPDVFPNESFPADAAVTLLDGTTDAATGLPYIAKGVGPASTPSYEIQYNRRQQRANRRLALAAAGLVVDEGGLRVGVYPFDYRLGGQFRHFDGATQQPVPDNATRYAYVDSANALQIAASEPADVTAFVPLARIDTAGGLLTITPRQNLARICVPQLGASAAGAGLSLASGALAVNADGATLEVQSDALGIKDGGVSAAKLDAALAGLVGQLGFVVGPEGAPGSGDRVVTLQALDARGDALTARTLIRFWIATAAFGAPGGTGQTVTVTTGTVQAIETVNAAYRLISDDSGAAVVRINVSGSNTRHLMAATDGRIFTTGAVTWGIF